MKIIEAKASIKSLWEDYNQKSPNSSFLQSFAWGDFQKTEGINAYRFAFEKAELNGGFSASARLIGIAQILRHPLAFGKSYLYIPHGPIIDEKFDEKEAWKLFIDKSREVAKKRKPSFCYPNQNKNLIKSLF